MTEEPVPRGRMSNRRRAVLAAAVLVVVALVAGAFWWTGDGQQRRRAVDGLAELPGVASAAVGDDDRYASVTMDAAASTGQVTEVLRRGVPVLGSDDYRLIGVDVVLGAARTEVSSADVGDGGDAATRADELVALAGLSSGTAFIPPGSPVLLRAVDDGASQEERLEQVLDALGRLADADEPVPDGLWGDGLLAMSEIEVPPGTLARALEPLAALSDDEIEPSFVTGGLLNLSVPDDLGHARARALVRSTADRLSDVRAGGRPVIDRIFAETYDDQWTFGVRVG